MSTTNTSSYLARFRQRALEGKTIDEGKASDKRKQKKITNGNVDLEERQQQVQTEQRDNNDSQDQRQKMDTRREGSDPINDNIPHSKETDKTTEVLDKIRKKTSNQKNQMKVMYNQFGANPRNVIHVEKEDGIPSPESPDEVIVKILASTVSIQDCLDRRGFDFNILNPATVPRIPGCDMVGRIYAKGSKVFEFKEGDRVGAFLPHGGGNARYICLKADTLIPIPSDIDPAEAVIMMSIYLMAYQVLKLITLSGPTFTLNEKKVLIVLGHGRTDPVGHALIQMCQKARALILVTAAQSQHEYYRTVWNVIPLPLDSKEWIKIVERRMDYVFDGLCEDGLKTPYRALKVKNPGTELICYGYSSMLQQSASMGLLGAPLRAHVHKMRVNLLSSMTTSSSSKRVQFVDIHDDKYLEDGKYKKHIKALLQLLRLNKLRPKVLEKVPLGKVADAQLLIESPVVSTTAAAHDDDSELDETKDATNQKLKRIEASLKYHGVVVCLPWMKERSINRDTEIEIDSHNASRRTPAVFDNEETTTINDSTTSTGIHKIHEQSEEYDDDDGQTTNNKNKETVARAIEKDETIHPVRDYSRKIDEENRIVLKTVGGAGTVITDTSSIENHFLFMCLDY